MKKSFIMSCPAATAQEGTFVVCLGFGQGCTTTSSSQGTSLNASETHVAVSLREGMGTGRRFFLFIPSIYLPPTPNSSPPKRI